MQLLRRLTRTFWCPLFGGLLHAWALTPWVSNTWPPLTALLQSGGFILLLISLHQQADARRAGLMGWVYGSAWLIGGTGWTYVSLHRYGELPAWLAGVAVLGLSAFLAVYLGAAAWAWSRFKRGAPWRDALSWAGLWILAEVARALIFTGFPWAASGYGLVDVSWAQLAPWLGVYGLGGCWAFCLALLVLGWPRPWCALGGLVMVVSLLWQPTGNWVPLTREFGPRLSVTLLQGNVPQDEKFIPELQVPMLLWHAKQLQNARTDLVLAPETAIPLLPSQLPDGYWDALLHSYKQSGRHALIGVPLGSFEQGYTNSVAGLSGQASKSRSGFYRYDKHHLVPFGEFIPFGFHWFVAMMNMPLGDFSRGPLVAPSFEVNGQRVAPTICYEDLYGEEIAARFIDASLAPTVLANVSNLAWFGEDVAIAQHLQIARMRSKEFQIPTIRATNTGATVVIDHAGTVVARMTPNVRGVLTTSVQGMTGVTPYAWWSGRFGLWPLVVLGLLVSVPFNRIRFSRR